MEKFEELKIPVTKIPKLNIGDIQKNYCSFTYNNNKCNNVRCVFCLFLESNLIQFKKWYKGRSKK